mmetsp:Transcript_34523/g.73547  ORF Transcript_34523/g.73547 Transcript_34523/m.73547 type:complete len:81 (+) Transcript_34523:209-451(+)
MQKIMLSFLPHCGAVLWVTVTVVKDVNILAYPRSHHVYDYFLTNAEDIRKSYCQNRFFCPTAVERLQSLRGGTPRGSLEA